MENLEIRNAILKKNLKHYKVAQALGISPYTFSHWLQLELPKEKKKYILGVIGKMSYERQQPLPKYGKNCYFNKGRKK